MSEVVSTTPIIVREPKDVWCVWTKHGRRPKHFHKSRELAEKEATRLAGQHPDRKFVVMQMVSKTYMQNAEVLA